MPDKVLTTIEATIMTKTKEALLKHCENTGLSIGEVIDRMALDFVIDTPDLAANVLCEEFVIMVVNQTEEQMQKTVHHVIASLMIPFLGNDSDARAFFEDLSLCIKDHMDLMTKNAQAS